MAAIQFFNEDVDFLLKEKTLLRRWLGQLATQRGFKVRALNYIFCSDEHLLQVNRQYLEHDYYTDIITFDQSEEEGIIEGDLFISIDRVTDHGQTLGTGFLNELHRVMAHGLLHLCGLGDKTEAEATAMRQAEEAALQLLASLRDGK